MTDYKNILVAVELDTNSDELPLRKAMSIAKTANAKLTLIHAVEHMSSYGAAYGVAAGADIEEMLVDNAKQAMQKLIDGLGLSSDQCVINVGPAKVIILDEAERLAADLIIVGSHGRHGIRLLLGSTANAILHGAKCDVLAVRIKEK